MAASPDIDFGLLAVRPKTSSPLLFALSSVVLAALGLSTIWPTVRYFWNMWTTDPLQSIGMMIPLISLGLTLRVWSKLEWRINGNWWGFALLVLTALAVRIGEQAVVILFVSPQKLLTLPPPQFIVFAYGSGVVLLLGGTKLYRAALFPIFLLLCVNPVPHIFYPYVDLPLQQISAQLARNFALTLGQRLTVDQLRLMFTPDFGMFIAPGCNGIRGAVTMGFIALIAAYVYRFRWYAMASVVVGAVLLGYAFNLLRLCVLVLYYVLALHLPGLQNHAEMADYIIGAVLFFLATLLLFTAIHRLRETRSPTALKTTVLPENTPSRERALGNRYAPLAAMGIIATLGCVGLARASATSSLYQQAATPAFPARFGNYTLTRAWSETMLTGQIVYHWAQYAPAQAGTPVSIGVAPGPAWHNPTDCHSARGEQPLWQGQLTIATAEVAPTQFSSAFYSDGVTQYLEASTFCGERSCGEYRTNNAKFGFIVSRPDPKSLLWQSGPQYTPLLIRVETADMSVPATINRQNLTQALAAFLKNVNLNDLSRPHRH